MYCNNYTQSSADLFFSDDLLCLCTRREIPEFSAPVELSPDSDS